MKNFFKFFKKHRSKEENKYGIHYRGDEVSFDIISNERLSYLQAEAIINSILCSYQQLPQGLEWTTTRRIKKKIKREAKENIQVYIGK